MSNGTCALLTKHANEQKKFIGGTEGETVFLEFSILITAPNCLKIGGK